MWCDKGTPKKLPYASTDLNIKAKKALPLTQEIPLVVLLSLPYVFGGDLDFLKKIVRDTKNTILIIFGTFIKIDKWLIWPCCLMAFKGLLFMICIYWPWCRILGSLLFNLDSPLTFARTAVIFCAVGTNSKSSEETPMVKLMDIDHKKERKVVACQNFIVMTSLSLYLHMSMTHLMTSNWMTCCRHRRSITTFWMLLPEPHTLIMPYCVCHARNSTSIKKDWRQHPIQNGD